MIYARATGNVSRAPVAQERPSGVKVATVGLTVNVSGEFLQVNALAVGGLADALMKLRIGETVELSGPIQARTHVDEDGVAVASFDVSVREVGKPQANRENQA